MANLCKTLPVLLAFFVRLANCYPGGTYQSIPQAPEMSYNASADVARLREAMVGYSYVDVKIISEMLTKLSFSQRLELAEQYKHVCKQDLVEQFGLISDPFYKNVFVALITPMEVHYAKEFYETVPSFIKLMSASPDSVNTRKALGYGGRTMLEILCTMTNDEVPKIKASYQQKYGETLEHALTKSVGSRNVRSFVRVLLKGERQNVSDIDYEQARVCAEILHDMEDIEKVIEIFATSGYEQLRQIFKSFEQTYGENIESTIVENVDGFLKHIFLEIATFARGKSEYFATRLFENLNERSVETRAVIRIMVFRSEVDLDDIEEAFHKIYSQSLEESLKGFIPAEFFDEPLVLLLRTVTE